MQTAFIILKVGCALAMTIGSELASLTQIYVVALVFGRMVLLFDK